MIRQYIVDALKSYDDLILWLEKQLPGYAWSQSIDMLDDRIIDILKEITPEEREAFYSQQRWRE